MNIYRFFLGEKSTIDIDDVISKQRKQELELYRLYAKDSTEL